MVINPTNSWSQVTLSKIARQALLLCKRCCLIVGLIFGTYRNVSKMLNKIILFTLPDFCSIFILLFSPKQILTHLTRLLCLLKTDLQAGLLGNPTQHAADRPKPTCSYSLLAKTSSASSVLKLLLASLFVPRASAILQLLNLLPGSEKLFILMPLQHYWEEMKLEMYQFALVVSLHS